ncbi:MAG: thiol:disulfide interchange protein [Acidobacteriota bacterium]|nr:thiol:disulfide interchange protein [Acidobacteriota bacterium]
MGYVGSRIDAAPELRRRKRGVLLSLAFFAGVVISLVALGIAAAYLGRLLAGWSVPFAILAALFSLVAGGAALFAPQLRRRFPAPHVPKGSGAVGAFAYGLAYSLATVTTGAGPLFLLLTITAAIGRPVYGAVLSLAYGVGRGLPFLLLGLFAGVVGAWLARIESLRRAAELVSGLALVGIGGYFVWLAYVLVTS